MFYVLYIEMLPIVLPLVWLSGRVHYYVPSGSRDCQTPNCTQTPQSCTAKVRTQRHRDTETQRHRDTQTQRHTDTQTQRETNIKCE